MIISNSAQFKLALLPLAVVLGFSIGCADEVRPPIPTAPTAPTPPSALAGSVTGLVRGEAVMGRHFRQHPPLRAATVTVLGGPASGTRTTTGEDGTYQLTAAGVFKLRFEHPHFTTSDSAETSMTDAGQIAMPDIVLATAPWSISGLVTDSLGTPVADARVTIGPGTGPESPYGTAVTDAEGRYTFNSTQPHGKSVDVRASKPGFDSPRERSMTCCGTAPDIRLIRIISITPTAPSSLRVGESVEMPASIVVFDTGETRRIFVLPSSSEPSVVNVARSSHWYAMTGFRAGVATLTFDLWGAIATMQVQVR